MHARSRMPAWLGWFALRGMPESTRPHFVTTAHGLNSRSRYSAVMTHGERVVCVSKPFATTCSGLSAGRSGEAGGDPARDRSRAFPAQPVARSRCARAGRRAVAAARRRRSRRCCCPGAARGSRAMPMHCGCSRACAGATSTRACGCPAREKPGAGLPRRTRALQRTLGIDGAVEMTPPTDAIAAAYAASDLVLQALAQAGGVRAHGGRSLVGGARRARLGPRRRRRIAARTAARRRGRAVRRRRARVALARCWRKPPSPPATIPMPRCMRCRRPRLGSTPNSAAETSAIAGWRWAPA